MMPKDKLSFTLLLPTLNEIEGLKHVLPQIDRSLFEQIIVTDGGSTDGTIEYCRDQGLKVVIQPNVGMPDAQEYAYQFIKTDAIVTFTPDGNSLPEVLPDICNKLREGYDMVIASRYLKEAKSHDDDFLTAIGNPLFTFVVNFLFRYRYTDTLVAFRAYTCEAVERMSLPNISNENWLRKRFWYMNSWELGSSIRAAILKLKVTEIPADEPLRIGGVRKLSIIKNGTGAVLQILSDFFFFRGQS
jgi:glycosyltransferase involved in cell wall biosynthesis